MNDHNLIPAYYINLATRPDRRQFMEQQFARLGMSVQRIEAVAASEVPAERLAQLVGAGKRIALSPVEVACLLSHERTWRTFLGTGAEHALVLEDDVVMSEGLPHFLDRALHAGLGVDLMKLETYHQKVHLGRARRIVAGDLAVRQLLSSHLGTGAYVISRRQAERALADPILRTLPIDCYLFDKRGPILPSKGIFQVEPAPVVQLSFRPNDSLSDVGRSDLSAERATFEASLPDMAIQRRAGTWARVKYKLRSIVQTFQDSEAILSKRRMVTFAGGESLSSMPGRPS
jgi:glycosyl transferase, family 25